MKIQVRLFAALRESVGSGAIELDLPAGATVGAVWQALLERHPQLRADQALSYARNRSYAEPDQPLAEGDEVALIPPVSGG